VVDPLSALGVFSLLALATAALFWPRSGIWWRWRNWSGRAEKIMIEDALKQLYHGEYQGRLATLGSLAGALEISRDRAATLVEQGQRMGLMELSGDSPVLTSDGRALALHVIRVHRLWECYLAERTSVSSLDWHREAERREHTLTPAQTKDLEARLNRPTFDPHGDPIPTAEGRMPPRSGIPITEIPPGYSAQVLHVEDEPEAIYAQLVALKVKPGIRLRMIHQEGGNTRLEIHGREVSLASLVASSITVGPAEESSQPSPEGPTLATLHPGQRGQVLGLESNCRGLERERLLDLGLVPGTWVEAQLRGPLGDPTAYRVRGATIALRREQADRVLLSQVQSA